MMRFVYASLAALSLAVLAGPAQAFDPKVVSITLPEDHDTYRPGPNLDVAEDFCVACHAADYVYMQPPLTHKQWQATVDKMVKVFKCPVSEDKYGALVEYLASQTPKSE